MKTIQVSGLRWYIAVILFLATVICYIDRLTISILAPVIKIDLNLTNVEYAAITTWFLISYSVFQSVFGGIYDKYGTRKVFSFAIVILWIIFHYIIYTDKSTGESTGLLGSTNIGGWPMFIWIRYAHRDIRPTGAHQNTTPKLALLSAPLKVIRHLFFLLFRTFPTLIKNFNWVVTASSVDE